ncbi:MAG: GAF domain-containing protein [Anaerolinea sp.]|nr:GAF domain-containing protein [Anaerolinea sp.]
MTDATSTVRIFEVESLRELIRSVNSLETSLRTERAKLQKMGMSLPPGMLAGLQQARAELEKLLHDQELTVTELSRLRELTRTAELINSTLDLGNVLNEVMDTVIVLTRAERGYLVLKEAGSDELDFKIARNIEHRTLDASEFMVSKTIITEAARTGKPVLTTNAEHDPRFENEKSIVNYALRSILCVPLIVKGVVTGVIYTDNRVKQGLFGEKEIEMLQTFANQAAVAIENARLYTRLQANLTEITSMKNLLDNVFASITSGILTTNAAGQITQVNDAACQILNIPPSCLGGPIWEVWTQIHEETLKLIVEEGIEETVEVETEVTGRGDVSLNLHLSPLRTVEGEIEGVAIVVDDLTEAKQRAAKLNVVRRYLPPAMVDNIHNIDKLGLGGERRVVTAVFVDVRSFNTLARTLNPLEFMNTLNRYLTVASDELVKQNGVIDKYMGSEIMGLFNTQLNPAEDHPRQALLAALNTAEEFLKFYRQNGESEGTRYFRIGVHTGIATLGNVGGENRREFTAIGDSINLSHRLLENAHPGEIVISVETWNQCQLHDQLPAPFVISAPEQIKVKNRREPIWIQRITLPEKP